MLQYLLELRQRLIRCLIVFVVLFSLCFHYAEVLLSYLLWPIQAELPSSSFLIATELTTPLWVSVQLASDTALFLSAPYFLFEAWRFFFPALYASEKRLFRWGMFLSLGLFLLGAAMCFFFIVPALCHFLITYLPADIRVIPEVKYSVTMILKLLWVFGLGFQIPLFCLVSVKIGWVTLNQLTAARRYVIVFAFVLGMLLAPPDVFSQTLLALPFWGVYEIGVGLVRLFLRFNVKRTHLSKFG